MSFDHVSNYDDFIEFLRSLKNLNEDEYIYDFGLIVDLFLALLDNLRQHGLEAELEDIGYRFNDDQRAFIRKIAEYANRVTDEDISNE